MPTPERTIWKASVLHPEGELQPLAHWPAESDVLPLLNIHVVTEDDCGTIRYRATHVVNAYGWTPTQAAFAAGWWYEQALADGGLDNASK